MKHFLGEKHNRTPVFCRYTASIWRNDLSLLKWNNTGCL